MDYDRWGFWFGVGAFIMSVPLTILATIVTPRLQLWWARRSLASMRFKVQMLQWEAESLEKRDPNDDFQRTVLVALATVVLLMSVTAFSVVLTYASAADGQSGAQWISGSMGLAIGILTSRALLVIARSRNNALPVVKEQFESLSKRLKATEQIAPANPPKHP